LSGDSACYNKGERRRKEWKMMQKDQEFYTVYEVAEMLRVSDRTIRKHIDQGLLKALKVGTVYRIMREDLEDYFERIKTKGVQNGR
jgi:excisionase family DNA binding protein